MLFLCWFWDPLVEVLRFFDAVRSTCRRGGCSSTAVSLFSLALRGLRRSLVVRHLVFACMRHPVLSPFPSSFRVCPSHAGYKASNFSSSHPPFFFSFCEASRNESPRSNGTDCDCRLAVFSNAFLVSWSCCCHSFLSLGACVCCVEGTQAPIGDEVGRFGFPAEGLRLRPERSIGGE